MILCAHCGEADCEGHLSRRGFISMLGSAALVAAAPGLVAPPTKLIAPPSIAEALAASLLQTKEHIGMRIMSSADFRFVVRAALNASFEEVYGTRETEWKEVLGERAK